MAGRATLAASDLHYGDSGQLRESLQECMSRAIDAINKQRVQSVRVLVVGDAVAGRGIYRGQEVQNGLQLGSDQAWYCARDIRRWNGLFECPDIEWVIILGNHDNTNRENLAQQLAMLLKLLGINVKYAGRTYIGNYAPDVTDGQWFLAEHGYGNSDYYANSYSEIRGMWRKYVEVVKTHGVDLSRIMLGHTHFLNIGQRIGQDLAIDTTGGWHRQDRLKLPSDARETGVNLYLHDGVGLSIQTIQAKAELVARETADTGLAYRNMAAQAEALGEMVVWASEQGLC